MTDDRPRVRQRVRLNHGFVMMLGVAMSFGGGLAVGLFGGFLVAIKTGNSMSAPVGLIVGLLLGAGVTALQFRRVVQR